jgi:hypothetical protein
MLIASLACWAFVSLLVGLDGQGGVLLGLIAPLAVTVGSWIAIERTHSRTPARVSGLMIKMFAAKLLVFGGYVTFVVILFPVSRIPFVVSFVAQYILLHLMEGLYLRRLFSGDGTAGERLGVS